MGSRLFLSLGLCFSAHALPPLFRVQPPSKVSCSYLLATFHSVRLAEIPPSVVDLAARSRVILLERFEPANGRSALEMRRQNLREVTPDWARLDPDYAVETEVTEQTVQAINQIFCEIYPNGSWKHTHPVFLCIPLSALKSGHAVPLDTALGEELVRRGKGVYGLETNADIKKLFQTLAPWVPSTRDSWSALASAVEWPDSTAIALFSYLAGHLAAPISPSTDDALAIALYNVLISERNRAWLPRIQEELSKGNAFLAVGADHLLGDWGLVPMLREQGFAIEQVMEASEITPGPLALVWLEGMSVVARVKSALGNLLTERD